MTDRRLFGIGVVGSLLAAVCCATPVLAIVLGALGLSAWLAWSDYVVVPALLVFLAIAIYGLARWRSSAPGCCGMPASPREEDSRTHARQDKAFSRDHT
ncbi:MAG: mercury resistance system transport protein MerF [Candidatus Rokubacteria bacterium]|nr:mercury resistance system transport protein MerF [Candidatus Rokubacteria bacterium]